MEHSQASTHCISHLNISIMESSKTVKNKVKDHWWKITKISLEVQKWQKHNRNLKVNGNKIG